eukprot:TRINITY_DN4587_c0_g1_i10.p2 TRINITY_DN4587_c0_g1~~TRINITY_DN4587_c0_g1_i10.p2  ORF type:complete len:232 (-),score=-5.31 TRINITY_DN4587_c0_g1_i10:966-1661(-)
MWEAKRLGQACKYIFNKRYYQLLQKLVVEYSSSPSTAFPSISSSGRVTYNTCGVNNLRRCFSVPVSILKGGIMLSIFGIINNRSTKEKLWTTVFSLRFASLCVSVNLQTNFWFTDSYIWYCQSYKKSRIYLLFVLLYCQQWTSWRGIVVENNTNNTQICQQHYNNSFILQQKNRADIITAITFQEYCFSYFSLRTLAARLQNFFRVGTVSSSHILQWLYFKLVIVFCLQQI